LKDTFRKAPRQGLTRIRKNQKNQKERLKPGRKDFPRAEAAFFVFWKTSILENLDFRKPSKDVYF